MSSIRVRLTIWYVAILTVSMLVLAIGTAPAFGQSVSGGGTPLTLAEAEQRATDRNPDIAQARMTSESAQYAFAGARAIFAPTVSFALSQRGQTSPTTSQLAGGNEVTTAVSSFGSGASQWLPWGGGRLSVDLTGNRSSTSNSFASYNPSFFSSVAVSLTQPLLKGFALDANRP